MAITAAWISSELILFSNSLRDWKSSGPAATTVICIQLNNKILYIVYCALSAHLNFKTICYHAQRGGGGGGKLSENLIQITRMIQEESDTEISPKQ